MIRHGEKSVQLIALRDTGNTLKDPITGQQVLVIGEEAARTLTGLTAAQLRTPLETVAKRQVPGLRLIPYRAVGQPGGMLLAMRFSDVKIGNRKTSALIALAPLLLYPGLVTDAIGIAVFAALIAWQWMKK